MDSTGKHEVVPAVLCHDARCGLLVARADQVRASAIPDGGRYPLSITDTHHNRHADTHGIPDGDGYSDRNSYPNAVTNSYA